MKKTQMSINQLEKYKSLKKDLFNQGWIFPESSTAFDNGFLVSYEITAQKRYMKILIQFQVSFSNKYISLQVAEHPSKNSEFFINFDDFYDSVDYLIYFLERLDQNSTHESVLEIIENIIKKFPQSTSFFTDDEEIKLNLENLRDIVFSDPANR